MSAQWSARSNFRRLGAVDPRPDDRGFFARSFCREEFDARGLRTEIAQCNVSHNRRRGTLRGLHYHVAPRAEAKLVRCTRGRLLDVVVDLRPGSPTWAGHVAVELGGEAARHRALYVPEGFAHGFQTLEDETEVFYQMFEAFSAEHARGARWDDPAFPAAFPWFGTQRYWQDRILELREQIAAMDEPPLPV